ncbi:PREDICTED: uncharacterized protein LOC106146603 [Chinchilla lanigera]|uniref:uncharacterized protein LOC106146603 n=1 Tax=Chinchilla lanigera TaxID=34839 RepID=UPI000696B7F8|nr:PREDICTED: uncharacterized protein LOC106146603 [Chinchilla lanigera]
MPPREPRALRPRRPSPRRGPRRQPASCPTTARERQQVTRQGAGYLGRRRRRPPTFFPGARAEQQRHREHATARGTGGGRTAVAPQTLWRRRKARALRPSGKRTSARPAAGPTAAGSCLTSGSRRRSAAALAAAPAPSGAHANFRRRRRRPARQMGAPCGRACAPAQRSSGPRRLGRQAHQWKKAARSLCVARTLTPLQKAESRELPNSSGDS